MKYLIRILIFILILFFLHCKKDSPSENNNSSTDCSFITNWSGLNNDTQLATNLISSIPYVDFTYLTWLNQKNNRIDIRSLTSNNFSDLQCLKQYIGNNSIVQLGESSHGTKEYSQIKVRMIKFLHEEMGFDVIAFESGLFECFYTNENISQFTSITALKNSIFYGVWGTPELLDLFTYIKNTYSTNRPLILAGFDCQFTSVLNSIRQHPSFLYNIVSKIDNSFALQQRTFDSLTINKMIVRDFIYLTQYKDSIKNNYSVLLTYLDNHTNELNSSFPQKIIYPQLLKQSIKSIMSEIDHILVNQSYTLAGNPESYKIRDSSMAENIIFLKEKAYSNKKIILWAHNYHIANSQYQHALYPDIKNMGSWLHEKYSTVLYTIGLYMLRGKTKTDWDWSIIDVEPPTSATSLEAILYQCRKKYLFVDLKKQVYINGNKWMYSTITTKTSGFANESMILKDVYDGIIFIDSSSVPTYLP